MLSSRFLTPTASFLHVRHVWANRSCSGGTMQEDPSFTDVPMLFDHRKSPTCWELWDHRFCCSRCHQSQMTLATLLYFALHTPKLVSVHVNHFLSYRCVGGDGGTSACPAMCHTPVSTSGGTLWWALHATVLETVIISKLNWEGGKGDKRTIILGRKRTCGSTP